ncbi:hypothetical protein PAPHI01_2046 [Pancytospora philotis]|nr:hypothetical protein PAPHI01_2046 [Pancytospora philotis]
MAHSTPKRLAEITNTPKSRKVAYTEPECGTVVDDDDLIMLHLGVSADEDSFACEVFSDDRIDQRAGDGTQQADDGMQQADDGVQHSTRGGNGLQHFDANAHTRAAQKAQSDVLTELSDSQREDSTSKNSSELNNCLRD